MASWRGAEYSASAGHHRALDDWFLARRPPSPADVVVDLGSGSGEFSARLAELVPDGRVVGVEPDPSMIEAARRHVRPNLEFVAATAQDLDSVVPAASVDLVVSRAMLHWVPLAAYPRVFAAVKRVLRPGGCYHSESAGAGNVPLVIELLDELAADFQLPAPPRFPDPGVVLELLERTGFEMADEGVRSVAQRRAFTRDELIGFVRSQVAVALIGRARPEQADAIRDATASRVERLRRADGSYDQTFVRLEILAFRPER